MSRSTRPLLVAGLAALSLGLTAPTAHAARPQPPKPVGDVVQLNTDPAGEQRYPRSATLSDGAVVTTWNTASTTGPDTSGLSVRATIRNADGSARTVEFTANATTKNDQGYAEVVALSNGGFVVAYNDASRGGGARDQRLRWFDKTGKPRGAEVVVNTTDVKVGTGASIAALEDGGVVATWVAPDAKGSHDVRARIVNYDRTFRTKDVVVPAFSEGGQSQPVVDQLSNGRIVIAWSGQGADSEVEQHEGHAHVDSNVYLRQLKTNGKFATADVRINNVTEGSQSAAKIAALSNGRFVVAWQDFGGLDDDGSGYVHGLFDAQAHSLLGDRPAYSDGEGYQGFGSVTALADGGYAITWEDRRGDTDVDLQRFTATGRRAGDLVRVNPDAPGRQQFPSVTAGVGKKNRSTLTVSWQDWSGAYGDADQSAIVSRRYTV